MPCTHDAVRNRRPRVRGRLACAAAILCLILPSATALAQDAKSDASKPVPAYQTFYLHNASDENQANEIITVLRNELQRARINFVRSENAIAIQGTPEDLASAQKILTDLDRPLATWRLDYTLTRTDDGKPVGTPQHAVVVVTSGSKTRLKLGNRVPVVTGSDADKSPSSTQVVYVDLGLSIEASLDGFSDTPRLQCQIEQSTLADEKSGMGAQDPVIHQTRLENTSNLVEGKPMVLGTLDLAEDGQQEKIQVTAERVRD